MSGRGAVDLRSGLIVGLWILLTAKNLLWAQNIALSADGPPRALGAILLPYILTLVVSATSSCRPSCP